MSVSQWVSHKRGEHSTGRIFPPIFTKLDIQVESQEIWSPIVFGGNVDIDRPKSEVALIFYIAVM